MTENRIYSALRALLTVHHLHNIEGATVEINLSDLDEWEVTDYLKENKNSAECNIQEPYFAANYYYGRIESKYGRIWIRSKERKPVFLNN